MGFWGRKIKIVLEMILEIFLQCTILLSGSIEYNLFFIIGKNVISISILFADVHPGVK